MAKRDLSPHEALELLKRLALLELREHLEEGIPRKLLPDDVDGRTDGTHEALRAAFNDLQRAIVHVTPEDVDEQLEQLEEREQREQGTRAENARLRAEAARARKAPTCDQCEGRATVEVCDRESGKVKARLCDRCNKERKAKANG